MPVSADTTRVSMCRASYPKPSKQWDDTGALSPDTARVSMECLVEPTEEPTRAAVSPDMARVGHYVKNSNSSKFYSCGHPEGILGIWHYF